MKENFQPRLPTLYNRCSVLQLEIAELSRLSEDVLADVHTELCECIAYWHADHKELAVVDPYEGLCLMLKDWTLPWPAMEYSGLNGLKLSQFLLAFAYGASEQALDILVQRPAKGTHGMPAYDDDDAACFAFYAGKAFVHAKQLIATGQDALAQKALGRKAA
jgi:hypothetical protein